MKSLKLAIPALLVTGLSLGMASLANAKHVYDHHGYYPGGHATPARHGQRHRHHGYRCQRPNHRQHGYRDSWKDYTRHPAPGYGHHDGHHGKSHDQRHIGYTAHH